MTSLAKYSSRTPRYILQPQDNILIRVAGPKQIPWEENTDLKNISLTGIAFTAPSDLCPSLGEFIKIEYEVPGSGRMANYALVSRIDDISSSKTLVGVKFYKMELAQRVILAQALAIKLRDQQIRRIEERGQRINLPARLIPMLSFILIISIFYISSSIQWMTYFLKN